LSSEQEKAVSKYDEVLTQLTISKEFCKQILPIQTAATKEAKRDARKAQFLQQKQETNKVREVIIIQDLLRQFMDECVRNDFLNAENGACRVDENEMNLLELFSKCTIPVRPQFSNEPSFFNSAKASADHLSLVVDGKTRQFLDSGFSYEKIKDLFNRIQNCGYFEKNIQVVELSEMQQQEQEQQQQQQLQQEAQERPAESDTPASDDVECKDDKNDEMMTNSPNNTSSHHLPSAPLPTQVPNPLFNGGNGMMQGIPSMPHNVAAPIQMIPNPQQQQQHQQQQSQNPVQMKTTVTAVENAFFNQMKYSQPQAGPIRTNEMMVPPNRYVEDFATSSISFLQDSLVEQQQQQAKLVNSSVNPSQQQQQQQQQQPTNQGITTQTFTNPNYPSHQPHHFPPGLKLQGTQNIPVNFTQQSAVAVASQAQQQAVAQNIIAKQSAVVVGATAAVVSQQQHSFPNMGSSPIQYLQQQPQPTKLQNLQEVVEQKVPPSNVIHPSQHVGDLRGDNGTPDRKMQLDKDTNNRTTNNNNNTNNEWNNQQQPQIDTWNNDTATAASSGNSQTGNSNYSRFNRNRGSGTGPKYNNYR
jgi:hypothetical protein